MPGTYLDAATGKRREAITPTAVANLTGITGTADNALTDVGAAFNQATLNNNFADVATKLNALLTALRAAGVIT